MITRDEFLEEARVHDLNHADVQRDYVFGWLISGIFQATELGEVDPGVVEVQWRSSASFVP